MKTKVLYGSIACIAGIFAVLIFLDFRKQSKAAENFVVGTYNAPVSVRHLFIAPEQVKVENWQVGEASVYDLKTNKNNKQISFHVAAHDSKGSNQFWLRTSGLMQFNDVDIEVWRLLDETNLRPGSEQRGFYFFSDGIPVPFPTFKPPPIPVVLERLEDENIVTPIGSLQCEHVFASVRSPDGELIPLLELWTHPSARPLGLVRARWKDATLDLVKITKKTVLKKPQVLLDEFDRNTPVNEDGSCTRCHAEGIGGEGLKLEPMRWLSGKVLNLTQSMFHYQRAGIIKTNHFITIQLTGKSMRWRHQALARLSWEKGSFWIKPDENAQILLSLDKIAHQGNIILQSKTGRLILDFQNELR